MFPFKIRFSKTLKEPINSQQIPDFLDIIKDMLRKAGADYFSLENNCLKFDNKLFKLTSNWNLMAPIDAGFIEIKMDKNDNVKITYGITIINLWIIVTFFSIIFWIFDKNVNGALIVFCFLGILNWIIALARHWYFYLDITDEIEKKLEKKE